jgi:hypothetical protein
VELAARIFLFFFIFIFIFIFIYPAAGQAPRTSVKRVD